MSWRLDWGFTVVIWLCCHIRVYHQIFLRYLRVFKVGLVLCIDVQVVGGLVQQRFALLAYAALLPHIHLLGANLRVEILIRWVLNMTCTCYNVRYTNDHIYILFHSIAKVCLSSLTKINDHGLSNVGWLLIRAYAFICTRLLLTLLDSEPLALSRDVHGWTKSPCVTLICLVVDNIALSCSSIASLGA